MLHLLQFTIISKGLVPGSKDLLSGSQQTLGTFINFGIFQSKMDPKIDQK